MSSTKFDIVIELARDAFFDVLAKEYPEIKTGDIEPMEWMHFLSASDRVARHWIKNNSSLTEPL
jgi:hypothetical protein